MSTDIQTRVAPPADKRIAYGKDSSQFGDLRLPKGREKHPLAIVVHGGWWHSEADLGYLGHLAAAVAAEGIATWNVEFRRLGATGGGWPATFLDVAASADYVPTLAKAYPIDLKHIVVMGHSSGGHLAMWLAARHRVAAGSPLHGIAAVPLSGAISIAGAVDLRMAQAVGLRDGFVNRPAVEDLLGGTPDEVPERYSAASPAELLPLRIPQVLLHGTADDIAPFEITESYVRKARALGDDAKLDAIEGADHFDPLDPNSCAFRHVLSAVQHLVGQEVSKSQSTLDWNRRKTLMEPRIDYRKVAPGIYQAMLGLEKYLLQSGLEKSLIHLIELRASQINGCGYCIDMHWKDMRSGGEQEHRLYGLDAWQESPYYTDRERAALAWAEAVTRVREGHVSDEVYEAAKKHFTKKELVDLTLAIGTINVWNRLNIAMRTVAGTYTPSNMRNLARNA